MSEALGPLEVCCDAPPYAIVQACRMIGLQSPEDVRWSRLSCPPGGPSWWQALVNPRLWPSVFRGRRRGKDLCLCGAEMPILEKYTFLIVTGDKLCYQLGQCLRCRTIFWEQIETGAPRRSGDGSRSGPACEGWRDLE
jgi:hypothetical protein